MTKSARVHARLAPSERQKLLKLAAMAGKPGNLSAGLTFLLARTPDRADDIAKMLQPVPTNGSGANDGTR